MHNPFGWGEIYFNILYMGNTASEVKCTGLSKSGNQCLMSMSLYRDKEKLVSTSALEDRYVHVSLDA